MCLFKWLDEQNRYNLNLDSIQLVPVQGFRLKQKLMSHLFIQVGANSDSSRADTICSVLLRIALSTAKTQIFEASATPSLPISET